MKQHFNFWGNKLCRWLVKQFPPRLLYWAAIQSAAIATSGQYGNSDPNKTSVIDMLQRLEAKG